MCDWERTATFKTYSFGEDFMFEVFVLMFGARAIFSVCTTDIFPSGEKKMIRKHFSGSVCGPKYICILKKQDLLLVQIEVSLHGASYGASHHGVVADAQEAHHLNVGGHRAGTGELR